MKRLSFAVESNRIKEEIAVFKGANKDKTDIVVGFLLRNGIGSMEDVTISDVIAFRQWISGFDDFSSGQIRYYGSLLEQILVTYYKLNHGDPLAQYNVICTQITKINKLYVFLFTEKIYDIKKIDYEIREKYENYIKNTIAKSKVLEYVKMLDQVKLEAIKKNSWAYGFKEIKYCNQKVFLPYYPDYEVAQLFYFAQDKDEVLFDFSVNAPSIMKRQVFDMLIHILKENKGGHNGKKCFILPLNKFYKYCQKTGIEDIEQLTCNQVDGFYEEIGSRTQIYMQLVTNVRKFLFLSAEETNWDANVWFMERFEFAPNRLNVARPVDTFCFDQINIVENKKFFQQFMKNFLFVSQKTSIQTIRGIYYDLCEFFKFLDDRDRNLSNINNLDIKKYIKELEKKTYNAKTFNRKVISVARLLNYFNGKEIINIKFDISYYLQKSIPKHNDRMVDEHVVIAILKKLNDCPIELRLMYLNCLCLGLRISEICAIKGNAYIKNEHGEWFKGYQCKMKSEKCIPVPSFLYMEMTKYISEKNISGDEYVFKNKKGGAYSASTFSKKFKNYLKEVGIDYYEFKSHDFRHSIATKMFNIGVPVETIRDYLGHKDSNMTKQYIDYTDKKIQKEMEKYWRLRE